MDARLGKRTASSRKPILVKTSHILFVTSLHRFYAYISITTLYKTIICIRDNRNLLKENGMCKIWYKPIGKLYFIHVRFRIILLFIIKSQVLGKQQTHFVRLCVILIHKGIRRDVISNELYWATCETKNQPEKQKVFFWQHQHVKTKSWKSPKNFLSSLREKFRQYNRPWKSFKWKRKSYKTRFGRFPSL